MWDVWVITQATHGLSFSSDASVGDLVQALSLDDGQSHVTVQGAVVGQIDLLLAALAQ